MYQRFSNVVLVRLYEQPEFLKCSLLDPVVCQNPAPTWTRQLVEAEQFSGEREHLQALGWRYGGIPVCNYGTPQQLWFFPLHLVNRVVEYDGELWGVTERVARPLHNDERATDLYTVENLNNPFSLRRFQVEEVHQALLDGRARTVGWRGTAGAEIPFGILSLDRDRAGRNSDANAQVVVSPQLGGDRLEHQTRSRLVLRRVWQTLQALGGKHLGIH